MNAGDDAPGPELAGPAVIDASVALRWLVPGRETAAALAVRDALVARGAPLYVPDLFWAESANALWRLTRGADASLDAAEAVGLLAALRSAPLSTEPVGPLASRALEIGCAAGVTAYDALYVALAELRGARLWTADRRLVDRLGGTAWADRVAGIEAAPG